MTNYDMSRGGTSLVSEPLHSNNTDWLNLVSMTLNLGKRPFTHVEQIKRLRAKLSSF